jgi:ABC-type transport system substrate-binding protein
MPKDYWATILQGRITRRRALAAVAASSAGAALLAACSGDEDPDKAPKAVVQSVDESSTAKRGGTFLHSISYDPTAFEPHTLTNSGHVTNWVYTSLVRQVDGLLEPPKGDIEGDVARSWEISPDRLTMTMKIHPEAHFSPVPPVNGRAADAEDAAFSWERFRSISSNRGEYANDVSPSAPIVSMTAVDKSTLQIKLAYPYAPLLGLLGINFNGTYYVVPKEAADTNVLNILRTPTGTGPWYVAELTPSSRMVLKRNPGFKQAKGDLPYLDEIVMPVITEPATGLSQYKAGNIYTYAVSAEDILTIKNDVPDLQLMESDYATTLWHVMFGQNPDSPFRDERVRQAYVMTWDRDAFLDTFYNVSKLTSAGFPVETAWESGLQCNHWTGWFLEPRSKDFGPNSKYFKLDVAEAKKLLGAAGHNQQPLEVDLHHPDPGTGVPAGAVWSRYDEVIIGMVENSGLFKLNRRTYNFLQEFFPRFQQGRGQFTGVGHYIASQQRDPTIYLYAFYHSSGGQYIAGDQKMDDLINTSLREFDNEKRRMLTWDIQRYEGEKQFFPRIGGATGINSVWPAVRNANVFRGGMGRGILAGSSSTGIFLDPEKAPLKRA